MENFEIMTVLCTCGSPDHQIIFMIEKEVSEGNRDVYMNIHLAKLSFWKRIRYAITYILGKQSRYGAFDEVILDTRNIDDLEKVVNYIKQRDESGKNTSNTSNK